MAEVFKLIICIGLVMQESGGVEKGARSMYNIVILNVNDTLRVCVPSFLYIVQNNLLYLSAANLDAATYQVSKCKCSISINAVYYFKINYT